MCLILLAYRCHAGLELAVAANRDEYHDRPALAARFWPEQPQLLAGRDLQAGGTWMGCSRAGRFAAVTNFREPGVTSGRRSRGELCTDFLLGADAADDFIRRLAPGDQHYGGFNLLLWDGVQLLFYSNQERLPRALGAGIYGISNGYLNTPWPKVANGRRGLAGALARGFAPSQALTLLGDRTQPPDQQLPDTGVGLDKERLLAPAFICSPDYGTRVSTVFTLRRDGTARWLEKRFDAAGTAVGQVDFEFSTGRRPPDAMR
jgi:uncharacterized protein with NRDE domain